MSTEHSLEEISEINYLLENINKEYTQGIIPILKKNDLTLFGNPHKIPKLKKIQINRGLGLAGQNTQILKKKIQETTRLGEGVIYEELCPKGKAYIKKRMAAGEKSSAYLSGRAVKVCKGQMKG